LLLVYVLAGKLGLRFAFLHASATPVWPPTGIALAAMLIAGYRVWPSILVGAFVVNVTTAGSAVTSLGIAAGNSVKTGLARGIVVEGDAVRLRQIVSNLLSNALKFTPPGGEVEVRLRCPGQRAVLTVSDTGPGIPPDVLPHVFERFRQADSSTTREHGGLGLGLAIVKHLVELHGGTVRAENGAGGRGARFTVELPIAA
jgi:signal transduction histidine kinase